MVILSASPASTAYHLLLSPIIMSSFFGRLSGKKGKESTQPPTTSAASSSTSTDHSSSSDLNVSAEDLEGLGTAAERGDEPELPDDSSGSSKDVIYTSVQQSLIHQRQGYLPTLTQCPWGAYTEDDLKGTQVRGPSYLTDSVKIPAGPPLYSLAHVDIFSTRKDEPRVLSVLHRPESYLHSPSHSAFLASQPWTKEAAAASLVLCFTFPGPKSTNMSLCMFFHRRIPPAELLPSPITDDTFVGVEPARVRAFDTTLRRFRQGSDAYRDGKLKIIPKVAEGPYLVRKAIGRVPALLGKKLKSTYVWDEALNALEVTADVGSSKVAGKIISLVKRTCQSLVVDMTFVLQGDSGDELPESVIGGVRISHCDMDAIQHLSDNDRHNASTAPKQG